MKEHLPGDLPNPDAHLEDRLQTYYAHEYGAPTPLGHYWVRLAGHLGAQDPAPPLSRFRGFLAGSRGLRTAALLLPLLLLASLWLVNDYYTNLPQHISRHETLVLGENRFVPGSTAALRVVVRKVQDAAPLAAAQVRVLLAPADGGAATPLYAGLTDAAGTADVAFTVPDTAAVTQTLIVETTSALGSDRVERPVSVQRDYRVLLSSDKPVYQPGQVIHLRALALGTLDRRPAAGQALDLTIADGKGNKVFHQAVPTSAYGVASADFPLATQVNTGPYKITATLGHATSETTVTVDRYTLPKFATTLTTERPYYLPGEHVRGTLKANYFYGKPVAGGTVQLDGATLDVARTAAVSLQGSTDAQGNYRFEFDLPAYFAGSDLDAGQGRFTLEATVTDRAQQTEKANLALPVAQSRLVIAAVPEGGQLRPGVDNILYILTSYPDGSPAQASVDFTLEGHRHQAQTGAYGLAAVHLTPQYAAGSLQVVARDSAGATATRTIVLQGDPAAESVLLRPDRAGYRVGETLTATILTSLPGGTVYLDLVRAGQTVSTRAVPMQGGQAQVAIDLTPDLAGTLELHAYRIRPDGTLVRDTRLVIVDAAADLNLTLTAGHDTYRPGDTAGLDVQVRGQDGAGAQAALGLAAVDESVFALAEQDPGFAKLYFLLDREVLQPKVELHGFQVPDLIGQAPAQDPTLGAVQQAAGQAALAGAAPQEVNFTLQANSHADALQQAATGQQRYFAGLSNALYALLLLLPLAMLGLSTGAAWRAGRLWRTLALAVVALLGVLPWVGIGLGIVSHVDLTLAFTRPLDFLAQALSALPVDAELLMPVAGTLCLIGLGIYAWRRHDRPLRWLLGLSLLYGGSAVLLLRNLPQARVSPDIGLIYWGLAATCLLPLALVVRAASLWLARRPLPALLSGCAALTMPLGLLVLVVALQYGQAIPMAYQGRAVLHAEEMGLADGVRNAPLAALLAPAAQAAAGVTPAAAAMPATRAAAMGVADAASAPVPPRLRQYFPETMLWLPDATTDASGHLHLDVPVADSITTWRLTALASTQDGRLGSTTARLQVFQDFFVDLTVPQALTVGDEVAVPVGVFNYLPVSQTVRLELAPAPWYDLLDAPSKTIDIAANDIGMVYFRVRARAFGAQSLKVTAWGSKLSDAVQRDVQVYPNGRQVTFTQSERLSAGAPVSQTVPIPAEAISGTQALTVKIYPGLLSQVVEGLDSILRLPSGCFEQTSSTTYPNVLVLDYLKTTNHASPETQLKAEEYINLGYQRLTTFEVPSGGFSLFGQAPADPMLTAYGLQEFGDMSRVHPVDPALIVRTANWLLAQQQGDGSWVGLEGFHESSLTNQTARLPVSAYVVWSLVESGFVQDGHVTHGVAYLQQTAGQTNDPYVLGLIANALVAADIRAARGPRAATTAVLDRLAALAQRNGDGVQWSSPGATFMGGRGQAGDVETTALVALAFERAGTHADLAAAALTTLIRQKDSFGTWYNTSATVLALKALIESVRSGAGTADATISVALDGEPPRTVHVTPQTADVVQLLSYDTLRPGAAHRVTIGVVGQGSFLYQIAGSYYVPWAGATPQAPAPAAPVTVQVAYDRTRLAVNDTVGVSVTVRLNTPGAADSALIDLGLPPGFTPEPADLDALVRPTPVQGGATTIARYELTGRQILVYARHLQAGQPLHFSYRLRARFPLKAQTPASTAYDYYNPTVAGQAAPQELVVLP